MVGKAHDQFLPIPLGPWLDPARMDKIQIPSRMCQPNVAQGRSSQDLHPHACTAVHRGGRPTGWQRRAFGLRPGGLRL